MVGVLEGKLGEMASKPRCGTGAAAEGRKLANR